MLHEAIAHVTEDGREHKLGEHLFRTAKRAADFASVFGFRQWGWLGGLWHDLGKYAESFQKKLGAVTGEEAHIEARARVDHSTAGALYAVEQFGVAGCLVSYISAGHHFEQCREGKFWLQTRYSRFAKFILSLSKDFREQYQFPFLVSL